MLCEMVITSQLIKSEAVRASKDLVIVAMMHLLGVSHGGLLCP